MMIYFQKARWVHGKERREWEFQAGKHGSIGLDTLKGRAA